MEPTTARVTIGLDRLTMGRMPRLAAEPCISWLKALADETRWRIVRELLAGPLTVNGLVERLGVPQYNVSKHLKILRDAGIIQGEKHGREMECKVATSFRRRLKQNQTLLDLGCCTFRFDSIPPKS